VAPTLLSACLQEHEAVDGSDQHKVTNNVSAIDDEQAIHALFDAGDRALMSADVDALSGIFADDYIQYDVSGQPSTKQQILANFRTGAIRYPSIVSTSRTIRLFGDWAIVHGSEADDVESSGQHFAVKYLYMDAVRKRDGRWEIVASQLVRLS
jgi:uncharacterized protein (TIGR02246 family)